MIKSIQFIATLLLAQAIISCDSSDEGQAKIDSVERDSAAIATSVTIDSTSEATHWLSDRYGPASGIIEYEVISGEQTTSQTWYFDQHGLREARYWRLSEGESPLTHITIIDSGDLIVLGPGDPQPLRSRWRPDPNTALPNFRHLTPDMRRTFALQELPEKTVLGKTCSGFRLTIGETISEVWTWEGMMLYGEIQGTASGKFAPIVMRAVSLQTDVAIPEQKFRMADADG